MEFEVSEAIPMPPVRQPNITMWGAPGSGKTTFLAALSVALVQSESGWRLRGTDKPSVERLRIIVRQLANDRTFPPATESLEHFNWEIVGQPPDRPSSRRGILARGNQPAPPPEPRSIRLDLLDPPGVAYSSQNREYRDKLMDSLVHSHGIVFLYDPIGEQEAETSFEHFQDALFELDGLIPPDRRDKEGRLPHRIAVCITKFDNRKVLLTAERRGLLNRSNDSVGLPTVSVADAGKLFEILCSDIGGPAVGLIQPMIDQYFHASRVRYFVTSSIGFYVNPAREEFDFDDFENVRRDPNGVPRVRGRVKPINVVEPLMWLGMGDEQPWAR